MKLAWRALPVLAAPLRCSTRALRIVLARFEMVRSRKMPSAGSVTPRTCLQPRTALRETLRAGNDPHRQMLQGMIGGNVGMLHDVTF